MTMADGKDTRYQAIFENSPVSIWEEDFSAVKTRLDGLRQEGIEDLEAYLSQHPETVQQCAELVKVLDVNRATLIMHEAKSKDELLAGLVNTFTQESFDTFREELIAIWRGDTALSRDGVVTTLGGEPRYVTVNFAVCPGYEESLAKVFVSLIDITERKQAEATLAESEQHYRTLASTMPDNIIRYDLEGRATYLNPALENLLGIRARDRIGKRVREFHSDGSYEAYAQAIDRVLASGENQEFEFLLPIKSDNPPIYTIRMVPERNEQGEITGALAISHDITERKQAEQERQAHTDFLANLDRVNRAIQHASDLESMMSDVLDEVLDIFASDRASLVYPCDPDAASWQVPMERYKPDWPGASTMGVEIAMTPEVAAMQRESLQSRHPVAFGAGTDFPISAQLQTFGDKSGLGMTFYPKTGKPWGFTLIQCSYVRHWSDAERRLFEEIGRRLADGLTGLLVLRDLSESESMYRRIVDTAEEGILILDEYENVTFINAHLADMLGYTLDELQQHRVTDFILSDNLDNHQQKLSERRQNRADTYERRLIKKDGTLLWALVSAAPIFDGERYSGALSMVTDITALKETEQKLQQSLEFTEGIINALPDTLFEVDLEGRYLNVWASNPELLAAQQEQLLGRTVHEVLSPESATIAMEAIHEADEHGASLGKIIRIEQPQGTRWFEESLTKKPMEEPLAVPRFLVLSRDVTERMQMEDAMRASEQLFRTLVEHSPDFIARYDRELRRIYINPALQRQFAAPAEQVMGKPPTESSPLTDPERYMDHIRQAIETASECTYEHTYLAPDGTLHWATSRFIPEFTPDGEVATVMSIASDITDRKRAEQERQFHAELLANIDRINRAIQSAADLESMMRDALDEVLDIFSCDRAFLTYPCDPNAKFWTIPMERTRPEYPGAGTMNAEIAMDEEVASTLELLLGRTSPVKQNSVTEQPLPGEVAESYDIKSFMSLALYPKIGKPWQFGIHQCSYARVWSAKDEQMLEEIGQRLSDGLTGMLVQRDMRESQRKLVEAQRLALFGNWELDLIDDTLTWSDEIFRIFEIDKERFDASYEEFLAAIHPDDRERVNNAYTESLKNKQPYSIVHRLLMKDGRVKYVSEQCESYFDAVGKPIRSVGTVQDITEQRLREDELRRYRDHLEEVVRDRTEELRVARDAAEAANKAKSVFLANMSHELRTPLNAILGFSHMMQQHSNLSSQQHETLNIINNSGEHLLKLINDVLEIAKIETGKVQLENATFDLHALVREVADMMRLRAQQKGLQLELDQSSEFPRYIKGDEARLRQVLVNLVSNAVKFTDKGSVTIRLAIHNNAQHHLLIEILDTGPGISKADQQHLFNPFVQLPLGEAQEGAGLGLSIVHQFVQLMGGKVSIESEPGKGSLFRVELPLQEAEETDVERLSGERTGKIAGLAPGQPSYRILIAEDHHDNQLLLTKLMTDIGMEVKIARDGKECVELFKKWKPDLIWMDQRMPIMDGIEATKKIRKLRGGKKVKIVAVTATAFKEQEPALRAAGMDDYVRKPYRFNEIYDSMARQLGVELLYNDTTDDEVQPPTTLTPEMLAELDEELRVTLHQALNTLDSHRITEVIHRIAINDPTLARLLSQLADNYDYPTIINALDNSTPATGER